MVQAWTSMLSDAELDPKIKAAICWTTARCNRSAGSLSMAHQFAKQQGISEQEMQLWDSRGQANLPAGLAKAIRFADKLTCQPTKITDADIAELRKDFSDRQTAHVIYTAATANALDRLTETLQLAVPN
jgi:alkylhydroperoxidase family enzyme